MDTMTRARTLSVSTLMNEPVYNMQREKIGTIEDYMLDVNRGCVEYAVLSFGGFLGMGEKLFAIPWQSMSLDTENHAWVIDISEERLDQAPGFSKDNWPDLSDTAYRESISTFWAVNTGSDSGARETSVSESARHAGQDESTRERDMGY